MRANHNTKTCQHPNGTTCGICVHECLCDLLAVVRAEEALKSTERRIEYLQNLFTK